MSIWLSYHSIDDDFDGTNYAWDCDPYACFEDMSYDLELDEEDDTSDWQVIVLDRFGDRLVSPEY